MATLRGVDVSHHQGTVDWAAVRRSGRVFAFCKATEGATWTDPRFQENRSKAWQAGLIPGAYHFLRRETPIPDQVAHFLRTVGNTEGVLLAVDVETSVSGTNPTVDQLYDFVELVHERVGRWPVVYTGKWWWDAHAQGRRGPTQCPLWHSRYADTPGPLYGGWDRFTFWQYTSTARVPGVTGNCDDNIFYGDVSALLALGGDGDMTPEQAKQLAEVHAWVQDLRRAHVRYGHRTPEESMEELFVNARKTAASVENLVKLVLEAMPNPAHAQATADKIIEYLRANGIQLQLNTDELIEAMKRKVDLRFVDREQPS